MKWTRNNIANSGPKKHIPSDQVRNFSPFNCKGPRSCGSVRNCMEGMTLMKPAAIGIEAAALATVWIKTFSSGLNGKDSCFVKVLWAPNPSNAACIVVAMDHPVCNPKYMLEVQSGIPRTIPQRSPRKVRL